MKTRSRIAGLTVVLTLAVPGVAAAETNVFNTTNKAGGKVSFKIKTNKKGVAAKVVAIKVTDLPVECLGDRIVPAGKLSVSLRDVTVRAVKNDSGGTFYRFSRQQRIGDKNWVVTGTIDKKGRKLLAGGAGVDYKMGDDACQTVGPNGTDLKKVSRRKR